MSNFKEKKISWIAPIIPSFSMAGIELGLGSTEFLGLISKYLVDGESDLYQFEMSPTLRMVKGCLGEDEIYLFNVHDKDLTNWHLFFSVPDHAGANPRALGVVVRGERVHSVKAWNFERLKEGMEAKSIYRGKLPEDVGLGDPVCDLLSRANLIYDDDEGLFYFDDDYGMLEVVGYGDIDEYPDQVIMAISIISKS